MVGEGEAFSGSVDVDTPGVASEVGTAAPGEAVSPELEETPDPGSFDHDFNAGSALSGFSEGEGADTSANARAIGNSISSMPSSDGDINTSAGPRPVVPTTGASDPNRVVEEAAQGVAESAQGLADAHKAIMDMPGPEVVQPHEMEETAHLEGLEQLSIEDGGEVEDMAAYVELGLAPEVQGAFDQLNAAELDASVAQIQGEVDGAISERDLGREQALLDAETKQNEAIQEAHQAQMDVVSEKRGEIQAERTSTCLLYTSPSPRDATLSRMPSSA